MARFLISFVLLILFSIPTSLFAQTELIEAVATHYAQIHPGLESYRVHLKTNKIAEMLNRMTSSMPQDMPRPDAPELMKFWNRKSGTVVRSTNTTAYPYMQQMINRFSQRFAIDLGTLFLPIDGTAKRAKLLELATIKSTESQIADSKIQQFEILFKQPTDVAGAFYGISLDLPQRQIKKLTLDIDLEKMVLVHMGIEPAEGKSLAVEIRHLDVEGSTMPKEVSITTPDGSIDEHFVTTFKLIDGYQLPIRQERKIRRPGLEEMLLVDFSNYELVHGK